MTKEAKQFIAGLLGAATVFTTSACAKTVKCDVEGEHSHTYITEDGYEKHAESEKEKLGAFSRTEEYKEISKEDEEKLKKINKEMLIRIDDNIDKLLELESSLYDYRQYQYSETEMESYYEIDGTGTGTIKYRFVTEYKYTNDKERYGLTGKTRIITHKFIGYKIVQNNKGKLTIVKSEPMNSIEELVNAGFEYIEYGKLYAAYNRDTNKIIKFEDNLGPDKVSGLVLKK